VRGATASGECLHQYFLNVEVTLDGLSWVCGSAWDVARHGVGIMGGEPGRVVDSNLNSACIAGAREHVVRRSGSASRLCSP
jgi:hypothetical protein